MKPFPVQLDAPNVGSLEKKYLGRAIDDGYVSTVGPLVHEFENAFARFLGAARAVSTQSGTAALHIALHELGIGPGDEVIVPPLTFIATVNPVMQTGAAPVFADVDPATWGLDPSAVENRVTRKTRAIIPVHLFGNPCDMAGIMRVAKKHRLAVIEDATESLGASYDGKSTGLFGAFGCYSFNGNKVITTGGGGMVVGGNPKRLEHIRFLINQARDVSKGFYHPEVGFNYRMTNIEAALGMAQIERLSGFLRLKKCFTAIYREELSGIDGISFQETYQGAESSLWLTALTIQGHGPIPELQERLKRKGIPTRRVFPPVTGFPPYRRFARGSFPVSQDIYEHGLCLPSSTLNTERTIRRVARVIKDILKRRS